MLEFIQAVLGVLVKALPAAVSQRRNKRLNELGLDLFIFYIQVNEALICAESILAELDEFVDRMTRHAHVGDNYAIRAGNRISRTAQLQRENLIKIGKTMDRLSLQLQVVDGQAYAKIAVLLNAKAETLDVLLGVMHDSSLPIPIGLAERLQAVMDSAPSDRYPIASDRLEHEVYLNITEGSIALNSLWNADIYRQVSGYLEKVQPRQQIAQIRATLEDIRSALEENFSIKEILLAASNDRFNHGGL